MNESYQLCNIYFKQTTQLSPNNSTDEEETLARFTEMAMYVCTKCWGRTPVCT